MESLPAESSALRPLIVNLDGTLLSSDSLIESIITLLKRNIFFIFLLPVWLIKGKAHFKQQIADRIDLDASLFPYNDKFLEYLKTEHRIGRRLILATASNEKIAEAVAEYLGIFDGILASDAKTNLLGRIKLSRLQELYGEKGFDYSANAMVDLPILRHAEHAILVNPKRGMKQAVERQGLLTQVIDNRVGHPLKPYLKAMRLHQWLKNILVFIPLLMAHRIDDPVLFGRALLAFISFSLCASSAYILNDLWDLPNDRQHPTKRNRPFAAGSISILHGILLIPLLLVIAFNLALLLPIPFVVVLAFYYILTLAYSLRLKQAALVDVLTLAGLYTLRIIAGAAAVVIVPSFWLLAFSMSLFLSLALVKRFTELLTLIQQRQTGTVGRGYRTGDLEMLSQFGCSSVYMAILVLALYINSDTVRDFYTRPYIIWLLCPLLLYMVMRIWLLARRDELHEDPVVFLIQDRRSQWLAAVGGILLWLAV